MARIRNSPSVKPVKSVVKDLLITPLPRYEIAGLKIQLITIRVGADGE
jgi:hypothetical protein